MTSPSIDVVLVRHGQSQWNAARRYQGHGGPGLTDLGRSQAERLAEVLPGAFHGVHTVVCSDLPRVRETAAPYLAATGAEARYDEQWREIDVGDWTGLSGPELEARDPEAFAALARGEDVARGGGETFGQLRARIRLAMSRIVVEAAQDAAARGAVPVPQVLVFTHGGPIRMAAAEALGVPPMGHRWVVEPANCAVTRIRHTVGGEEILASELLDHDVRADELAARLVAA